MLHKLRSVISNVSVIGSPLGSDQSCCLNPKLVINVFFFMFQSGVTSTPLNVVDRVSLEAGGQGLAAPGQAPAVSYRLVKFDSSSGGQLGDNPGRFMLSGESAQASTNLFQTASLAKPAHKKVRTGSNCFVVQQ